MRISNNFTLDEFEQSLTATRLGIPNMIPKYYLNNLQQLVNNVLQPTRDHFGPVIIGSGYRSLALNQTVGGSKNSDHITASAADFTVKDVDNIEVAAWIRDNCVFNQLILEFYIPGKPRSGWIHCSYTATNKNQVLKAARKDGRVVYSFGLP